MHVTSLPISVKPSAFCAAPPPAAYPLFADTQLTRTVFPAFSISNPYVRQFWIVTLLIVTYVTGSVRPGP